MTKNCRRWLSTSSLDVSWCDLEIDRWLAMTTRFFAHTIKCHKSNLYKLHVHTHENITLLYRVFGSDRERGHSARKTKSKIYENICFRKTPFSRKLTLKVLRVQLTKFRLCRILNEEGFYLVRGYMYYSQFLYNFSDDLLVQTILLFFKIFN